MNRTIRTFVETVEMRASLVHRVRQHPYFSPIILLLVFLTAAGIHIWQRVRVRELAHEVALLEQHQRQLINDEKKLRADIAALSTATRIETYAAESLGLELISSDRLFTLEVRPREMPSPTEIDRLLAAVDRIAEHLPTVEQNLATAAGGDKLPVDSLKLRELRP